MQVKIKSVDLVREWIRTHDVGDSIYIIDWVRAECFVSDHQGLGKELSRVEWTDVGGKVWKMKIVQ